MWEQQWRKTSRTAWRCLWFCSYGFAILAACQSGESRSLHGSVDDGDELPGLYLNLCKWLFVGCIKHKDFRRTQLPFPKAVQSLWFPQLSADEMNGGGFWQPVNYPAGLPRWLGRHCLGIKNALRDILLIIKPRGYLACSPYFPKYSFILCAWSAKQMNKKVCWGAYCLKTFKNTSGLNASSGPFCYSNPNHNPL